MLRSCNFDPTCLKRRSSGVPGMNRREFSEGDDLADTSTSQNQKSTNPNDIVYWTNHRVMEWLRSVDLSEYAPNLRGSGVHGALMVRLIPQYQNQGNNLISEMFLLESLKLSNVYFTNF